MKLPTHTMTDQELTSYVTRLNIPYFRGVHMRDQIPRRPPRENECGILNLNTHLEPGSHWTCWFVTHGSRPHERYYFDSFGEPPPPELMRYLKTPHELKTDKAVIRRSAVTVQHDRTNECGALCLYVLKHLTSGVPLSHILAVLLKRYESHDPDRALTL